LLLSTTLLAGCTIERVTEPQQTATEQLLVSTAVDHAIGNLKPPIAPGRKVFVDATNFDTPDGNLVLPKYTIGAVRDLILRSGGALVDDRKAADLIVELRNGAQGIDHKTLLIGIPSLPIPIPLTGTVQTPELALYKDDKQRGISKIALTIYSAKTGALAVTVRPALGDSVDTQWTVLLLFSWDTQNIIPANIPDPTKALATTK
jgi:hypothetical protein